MAGLEDIGCDLLETDIRVFLGKGGAVDISQALSDEFIGRSICGGGKHSGRILAAERFIDGIHPSRVNRQIIDKEAIRAPRGFFEVVVFAAYRGGTEF